MFANSPEYYPYSSQRSVTYGKKGMVATTQVQAANAGLSLLKQGGNAVDAAIATAAALTVVEPTSNGIGGDAFALVWIKGKLHGLNASGPAPQALQADSLITRGFKEVPLYGWEPVTVPGCPSAWAELSQRFGKLTLRQCLQPAIDLARDGFVISPTIAAQWKKAHALLQAQPAMDATEHWRETFTHQGKPPQAGDLFSLKDHATTLEQIAETKGESFYRGEIADAIIDFSKRTGGYFCQADFADYKPQWVDPISIHYKGYDIWEIPPNGQGMLALMALNILKKCAIKDRDNVETLHAQIESMKLAYIDGQHYIADPQHMPYTTESMLSESYADQRRALITETAIQPTPGKPPSGGTVYLATADNEGNMVSFIQSNYHDFGSGIVIPHYGICLQNRGRSFSLDKTHPNFLAGGKKPLHTIIPGFITQKNQAIGPFGVMGGFMQPQGHIQVVMNMIDFNLNPQAALDAPRWQWLEDKKVALEPSFPIPLVKQLAEKGHAIEIHHDLTSFGRGQIILRNPTSGVLCGGTEGRADGYIASY